MREVYNVWLCARLNFRYVKRSGIWIYRKILIYLFIVFFYVGRPVDTRKKRRDAVYTVLLRVICSSAVSVLFPEIYLIPRQILIIYTITTHWQELGCDNFVTRLMCPPLSIYQMWNESKD